MSMTLWTDLFDDNFFRPSWQQDIQHIRRHAERSAGATSQLSEWRPTSDLKEGKDGFTLSVELPGVKKEDINVTLDKNILTVSGKREHETRDDTDKFHRVERFFGNFSRSVRVPEGIKEEDIKPTFDNGVLHIKFPSKAQLPKPERKQITIQ
eukprot:TRINITY_DN1409_c0_g1_i3.p1 TRINITY_DN1409_c0_g1~~TRINITY_DN1409_c0_g1_i3.p1  ORF type:complete len:152 (-),score=55.08 TRINITY_DN1409_c0_g1_i3:164-619(-)